MLIGLTYDLRSEYLAAGYSDLETAEFDRGDTIDSLEAALRELGHDTDRIGRAAQLVTRLAGGDRWDLVFNICEGLSGYGREAQVPALLDVFGIPYTFGDPCTMSVCLQKSLTKSVIRDAGLLTPRSFLAQSIADCRRWLTTVEGTTDRPTFPLFLKPVSEGTGKGITAASRSDTAAELLDECERLLAEFRQPVLVEEYLPGREFTVGLLGSGDEAEVLGTLEIILRPDAEAGCYSYLNKEYCEELVEYRLVRADDPEVCAAEQTALAAWKALNGRDAGRIDLRSDAAGRPQFLEANPLAGLHPQHSDLPMLATAVGMSYMELIRRIVDSAAVRIVPQTAARSVLSGS
ncbi:MAG: D-alanine--D-alanine ligase [Planctomycetaceae bacterium]|nr:D-alanine--D-alanine ligase [Planctomycetaceae bacterium]